MIRVIIDTSFAGTIIYPTAYSVDVVDTPNNDMLVVTYKDNGFDRVATYPMHYIYRYTVSPPVEEDEETTEKLADATDESTAKEE